MIRNFKTQRIFAVGGLAHGVEKGAATEVGILHPLAEEIEDADYFGFRSFLWVDELEEPVVPSSVTCFQPCDAQFFLGFEVRIKCAFGRTCFLDDLLDAGTMVALFIEELGGHFDDFVALG